MKNNMAGKWRFMGFAILGWCAVATALLAEERMVPYIYLNTPNDPKNAQAQFPSQGGNPQNPQAEEFLKLLKQNQQPNTAPPSLDNESTSSSANNNKGKGQVSITKVQGPSGEQLYTIEYRDADIQDVIEDISEITGRNFLLDPKIKGPITILSPTPIDAQAVWEVFLSALEVRDFTIVETGSITKIVPLGNAKSEPIKTYSGAYTPGTENYITRLYTLENVSASDMVVAIKPLISQRGDIQAYKQTNTLIITESGANIRRVIQIIKSLDKEGAKEQLTVIPLRFANPTDVVEKIKSIYQKEENTPTTTRRPTRVPRGGIPGLNTDSSGEGPLKVTTVLADERINSVVVVSTEKAIEKIMELVRQLDVEVKNPRGNIHVYYLQHANADELVSVLSGTASNASSSKSSKSKSSQSNSSGGFGQNQSKFGTPSTSSTSPGTSTGAGSATLGEDIKIVADKNTNSLIVTSSFQDFETLKGVIAQLDIPRRQVFVETVIMELGIDQSRTLGISLTGGGEANGNPIFGGTSFTSLNPLALNSAALAGLSGLNVAGISDKTVTLTLSDGTTTTVPAFSAVLQALETSTDVNILSTPNILTTDNEEAEIIVGQNVPFVTSSGRDSNNNPIIQVQRQDVAITLRVTPHIKESDFIRLDVFQEITELVPNQDSNLVLNQGPTTTKRSADTTVVVKGEQTVVLGGLIDDKTAVSESRIPYLGKIPILGALFRSRSRSARKTNLLIFLTPYIIDKPEDFQRILVKKMEERNSYIKRNYGWIQRREIRASIENHQKALLDLSDKIEKDRKQAKKSGKAHSESDKNATPASAKERHIPERGGKELHRKDVDVDNLLEAY